MITDSQQLASAPGLSKYGGYHPYSAQSLLFDGANTNFQDLFSPGLAKGPDWLEELCYLLPDRHI